MLRAPSVTLVLPPLDSETGWIGELWSNTNLLKILEFFLDFFLICLKVTKVTT